MTFRRRIFGLSLLAILLGFVAVQALQERIDVQLRATHQEKDDLLFRSGRLVKLLSLGYDTFLADVYWTRVVQYYGEKRVRRDPNLELLAPLLDLATTLYPHLVVAYRVGAIFVAEPRPQGAGRPDLAVDLIRRGIQNNPDEWKLWSDLGFVYYWELKDYHKASQAFLEGSKNPKAREWMKVMAAKIAEEGQSYDVSLFLWKQVYDSTQDVTIRQNALNHLQALQAEEDIRHIEDLVARYRTRFGYLPASTADLVRSGLLPALPVDPAGFAYVLGSDGKVHLDAASPIPLGVLKAPPKP